MKINITQSQSDKIEVVIKLKYKTDVYISNFNDCSPEQLELIKDLITTIAKGKASHFDMKSGDEHHYFNKKILEESIITIIKKP